MRLALLSDIHANLEALEACLAQVERIGVDRYVFLGDFVGYGADPQAVVDRCARLMEHDGIAILGNHDEAIWQQDERMNPHAARSVTWTARQLDRAACQFLKDLPLQWIEDDRQYVHGDASQPADWRYVQDITDAELSMNHARARIVLSGHVHVPAIFCRSGQGRAVHFPPVPGEPVPLKGARSWHIVLGSVGQPRDRNPSASWSLYDTDTQEITFWRVPYDIDTTASKIRAAGLPEMLARRLYEGR